MGSQCLEGQFRFSTASAASAPPFLAQDEHGTDRAVLFGGRTIDKVDERSGRGSLALGRLRDSH